MTTLEPPIIINGILIDEKTTTKEDLFEAFGKEDMMTCYQQLATPYLQVLYSPSLVLSTNLNPIPVLVSS